jgi:hypothetical protein
MIETLIHTDVTDFEQDTLIKLKPRLTCNAYSAIIQL